MKSITRLFSLFPISKQKEYFAGRWSLHNNKKNFKVINIIVDRNNEDHCGSCTRELKPSKTFSNINNELYYLPYVL